MVKVTFTLDEATIARLNETAQRLAKPKSEVVREAIEAYHAKSDRLSEAERQKMLKALSDYMRLPPTGTNQDTDRELREIRAARRSGGRRTRVEIIVILVDTSFLVDCLTGERRSAPAMFRALERGDRLTICAIVLYEWLRGPRVPRELSLQETLFPSDSALPFETADARISAELYQAVKRPRGRELDLAIAACAIRREAELWTLNRADFADIPRLRSVRP
jgi:predicted nucleic acid-binding protein